MCMLYPKDWLCRLATPKNAVEVSHRGKAHGQVIRLRQTRAIMRWSEPILPKRKSRVALEEGNCCRLLYEPVQPRRLFLKSSVYHFQHTLLLAKARKPGFVGFLLFL